jgi:glucokinase
VLVADIGGTNARFAVLDEPGGLARRLPALSTRDPAFADAAAALAGAMDTAMKIALAKTALPESSVRPRSLVLAVAGPVHGVTAELTNAAWRFDGPALVDALGVETGLLLNDFEALAMAAPSLRAADVTAIGAPVAADPKGPMLVLGPGTGFGAATVLRIGDGLSVLPGEAGHIELGPATEAEAALWSHLERVDGRITVEALLSGSGLGRLEAALAAEAGCPQARRDGGAVAVAAQAGEPVACQAVALFARLLGRVAGDLALVVKATGGVFIAGGVTPKLLPLIDASAMRTAFDDKAPMDALMRTMPLGVVTVPDPAFLGLAAAAANPGRWGVRHRLWR